MSTKIRQERLKKAERMAGELNNRAAEMDHELEMRIQKAQEEFRNKEIERENAQKLKKKNLEQETQRALDAQLKEKEVQKQIEEEERKRIAQQYQREAHEFGEQQQLAYQEKLQKRRKIKEDLGQQLQIKAKQERDVIMSKAELKINSDLLRKVVEKLPTSEVPTQIVESLNESQGKFARVTKHFPC